ncbi:MAG: sugar phosphate isomerase/epimerase [Actinomycetota bacterium]
MSNSISEPLFSLCGLAFPDTSIEHDIAIARAEGIRGLGIDERKMLGAGSLDAVKLQLAEAEIIPTICVPAVMTFLPGPFTEGPEDPRSRSAAMCEGVRRLAELRPEAIFCLTGPTGELDAQEARKFALEAMREVAACARECDVRLAFEPFRFSDPNDWSLVFGIEDGIAFLDEAEVPEVGICYDVWHLWDSTPDIVQLTSEIAPRVSGVQISDYRSPTRSWQDRVVPGDGIIPLADLFRALREGGFDGWYDLEIFSDDGRFGDKYEDSVWNLPPQEVARLGKAGFEAAWAASFAPKGEGNV